MRMRLCRALRGGNRTVYPPSTHDYLIELAFPQLADFPLRSSIKRGSREVDAKYRLLPVTLIETNAPQHAMTPYHRIVELIAGGESPERAVALAREWAKAKASRFVDECGERARDLFRRAEAGGVRVTRREALMIDSHREFGCGCHTIMDNVSPAHSDFQVYAAPYNTPRVLPDPIQNAIIKGVGFARALSQHNAEESHEVTGAEARQNVDRLRNFYRNIYGERRLKEAVG